MLKEFHNCRDSLVERSGSTCSKIVFQCRFLQLSLLAAFLSLTGVHPRETRPAAAPAANGL